MHNARPVSPVRVPFSLRQLTAVRRSFLFAMVSVTLSEVLRLAEQAGIDGRTEQPAQRSGSGVQAIARFLDSSAQLRDARLQLQRAEVTTRDADMVDGEELLRRVSL